MHPAATAAETQQRALLPQHVVAFIVEFDLIKTWSSYVIKESVIAQRFRCAGAACCRARQPAAPAGTLMRLLLLRTLSRCVLL